MNWESLDSERIQYTKKGIVCQVPPVIPTVPSGGLRPPSRTKRGRVQNVPGEFQNEFDRSVIEPRKTFIRIGEIREPLTGPCYYALFEPEINKPDP